MDRIFLWFRFAWPRTTWHSCLANRMPFGSENYKICPHFWILIFEFSHLHPTVARVRLYRPRARSIRDVRDRFENIATWREHRVRCGDWRRIILPCEREREQMRLTVSRLYANGWASRNPITFHIRTDEHKHIAQTEVNNRNNNNKWYNQLVARSHNHP